MTISIAAALAEGQRRGRIVGAATWRDPSQVGRTAGLRGARLRAEVNRAERLGLIDRKELVAGDRIALTDLGWQLFGLDERDGSPSDGTAEGTDSIRTAEDDAAEEGPRPPALADPDDSRPPLVQLLIHWRTAIPLAEHLADHLGLDVEGVWDEVLALERAGWVETWPDHPAGPAVMLSGSAADELGLALSSDGSRWLRPWQADPTTIDAPFGAAREADLMIDDNASFFGDWPDPDALDGPRALAADEALEEQAWKLLDLATKPDGPRVRLQHDGRPDQNSRDPFGGSGTHVVLPRPRHLLGADLPWPTSPGSDGRCAGCRDRHLSRTRYCLVCDRSGMDDLIAYLLAAEYRREKQARPRVDRGRKAAQVKAELGHARAKGHAALRGGIG